MSTIAAAHVRYVALPTGMKSFVLPNGHRTPTDLSALVIRVTDTDAATGVSLLWAQRDRQLPVLEAALRYVAEAVVGQPADPAAVAAGMRLTSTFLGHDGVIAFAMSGLEMAVQDLALRRRGTSLSDALGRRHDRIRAYQTGLMLPATTDELVEEAAAIHARGIKAIKMIIGKPTIDEDLERIRTVKAALPENASLMVDALQRWSRDEALSHVEKLAGLDLVWLEDPIRHDDLPGYRALVERSPVPIATGETCFSTAGFEARLDVGVPYVIAELERTGGFSGWLDVARLVARRGGVMLPHIYPHVSAQLVATLPQEEVWWEFVPWFDQLVPDAFDVVDGFLPVSTRPGSGFDPSADALERLARTPWITLGA